MRTTLYSLAAAVLLTTCNPVVDQSEELVTIENDVATATVTLDATRSKIEQIDDGIGALMAHQAEDPVKMQRLIDQCVEKTGAQMEGEGAMRIAECVNQAW